MRSKRRRRRSYTRVKWLLAIILILVVAAAGVYAGVHRSHSLWSDDGELLPDNGNIVNIMLLGVDKRADDVGRSDTLMVASVDMDSHKAALLSVPRDTRVAIDGHGYDKINHAYAFGGHELSKSTVERLLGTHIDHYVIIDTKAFQRIIDALGGVDIDVDKRMHYEDPWDDNGGLVIDLYPGQQHLDGARAIQYVRYRDGEGDIGRIGRQQKFMKAVLARLISPSILPKLPDLVTQVSSAVTTDMSVPELLKYAKLLKDVHDNGMTVQMVPGQPAYLSDISYWIPDIVGLRTMLAEELGLSMSDKARAAAEKAALEYQSSLPEGITLTGSTTGTELAAAESKEKEKAAKPHKPGEISVMVINSSGINGAGAEVARVLQEKGFIISGVETGKTSSREHTTITTAQRNTDIFYGMPFTCIIMDGGGADQAVVNIGRDYVKKGK